MAIMEILNQKRQTYTEIAKLAGVSRNTIGNARKNPERATLGTLRKICRAMGYEIVLILVKSKKAK
jgi:transcriptional regulator with XRE-family HTH domain